MANEEHLALIKQGVDAWNKWREEHPDTRPDLSHANLSGADLSEAYVTGADLNLIRANLNGATISLSDISDTISFQDCITGWEPVH
jgi:hypothetical protein